MALREKIAREIEDGTELLWPPKDEAEQAVYESLTWAASIARGEDNYMTNILNGEENLK